jgi:hypothetical protein
VVSDNEQAALDVEREREAQRIFERLKGAFEQELLGMARLMASKEDRELLGRTEFEIRDRVHRLGAQVLEAAADERVKKGGLRKS